MNRPLAGRAALAILVMAVVAPVGFASEDPRPNFEIEEFSLSNGLMVVLSKDNRLPKVALSAFVACGGAHDPAGRSGFAHLFEHLAFLGSEHIDKAKQDTLFVKIGSSDDAFTDYDLTSYEMVGPAEHLETMLWLESDRLGFLTFSDDGLAQQKRVVHEERKVRREQSPYSPADIRLWAKIFPDPHPYAGMVLGSHGDIDSATAKDVRDFYTQCYVASNITLVIVGDFESGTAKKLIEKYFGSFAKKPRPALPPRAVVQAPLKSEIRENMTADVSQARVSIGWIVPAATEQESIDFDLISALLAGGKASLLYRRLVVEQRLVEDVSCTHTARLLGGTLRCDLLVAEGHSEAELLKALDAALEDFSKRGPSDDELGRVKTKWKVQLLHEVESLGNRARFFYEGLLYTGHADVIDPKWERVTAISPEQIKSGASRWLSPNHRAVVVVTPSKP